MYSSRLEDNMTEKGIVSITVISIKNKNLILFLLWVKTIVKIVIFLYKGLRFREKIVSPEKPDLH